MKDLPKGFIEGKIFGHSLFIVSILIFCIVLLLSSCGNPKNLDVDLPKGLQKPSVIYYTSDNCGWCRKFEPNWNSVKDDDEFSDVKFYTNIHSKTFGIRGIPAIILIDKDGNVKKVVGYHSESTLRKNIKKYAK